jgi:uncharacterized protein YycO
MKLSKLWYNIKKFFISWVADIRIYNLGIILWGSSYYKLKGTHIRQILNHLKPGDILLRKYDHYLGSIVIPGFWSHAAIYVGNNEVVHMMGHGIVTEDILTFTRADHMCILRHVHPGVADAAAARAREFAQKKVEYDYNFDEKEANKMYCTEFANVCYDGVVNAYLKGKDILPDDFLKVLTLKKIWSDLEN